ncbi:hypothetical protein IQ256_01830 [cf. Phormidesmis sp. LEGE 11477]|nr:hypothetical protein [cf. Phormidesmis sp. LEGE 11477]
MANVSLDFHVAIAILAPQSLYSAKLYLVALLGTVSSSRYWRLPSST